MTPTVNWILVPIDFSDESRLALQAADGQAKLWNSGLILLHVKNPAEHASTRLTIEESALERWGRWVENTPKDRVAYITCAGDPVEVILRVAQQYNSRKIIMGRGGDAFQAGSITREVGERFPGIMEAVSATHDDVFQHAKVAA